MFLPFNSSLCPGVSPPSVKLSAIRLAAVVGVTIDNMIIVILSLESLVFFSLVSTLVFRFLKFIYP